MHNIVERENSSKVLCTDYLLTIVGIYLCTNYILKNTMVSIAKIKSNVKIMVKSDKFIIENKILNRVFALGNDNEGI